MNKKSKGYVGAIVFTILAVSLVIYQIQLHYGINIFNTKEEVLSWSEEKKQINSNSELIFSKDDKESLKQIGLYEKIKNSLNSPDKEDIQFKMFNAVDNFKTAKGEFFEEYSNPNDSTKFIFAIDTQNKTSITSYCDNGKENITTIIYNNKNITLNDNNKTYTEEVFVQNNKKPILVRPIKLFLNNKLIREDLQYLQSSEFIISSKIICSLLFIYNDWNYIDSKFLGRDAYKVDGVVDPALSNSDKGKFSLFIDKETGIILQYLSFDENGGIKYKLECTKLEINTPIDESIYNKDTSGYTKK